MKRIFLLLSILLLAPLAHAGGYEDFSAFNLDWSGGNNSRLAFYSPLTSTSTILSPPRAYPGTAATFSRASAQYITDFEGVVRKVESGSVAVEGSRVVTNLLTYSEDLSNAAWVKQSGVTVDNLGDGVWRINFNADNQGVYRSGIVFPAASPSIVHSIWVKADITSGNINLQDAGAYGTGSKNISVDTTWRRFSIDVNKSASGTDGGLWIRKVAGGPSSVLVKMAQSGIVVGQTNTNPGEYVRTTSSALSQCFSTTNGNTVDANGVVTEATGTALPQSYSERQNSTAYALNDKIQVRGWWYYCTTAGTSNSSAPTFLTGKAGQVTVTDGTAVWTIGGRLLLGYVSEPASTNKVTAYGIIPADTLGSELSSGSLTIGQKYQITARTDANFIADGAADNNVGTQFVATAATVTLDAGDKVKRVQWGVGEKSFHNGSSFVQNISGLTLSGDTAAVLSIVTDQTEIEKAGLAGINPTYKVYKLDNSAGSTVAFAYVNGATGNLNNHSMFSFVRGDAGALVDSVSGASKISFAASATYVLRKAENWTPNNAATKLMYQVEAGKTVYFLLPQLEELPYATSIMPTAGATATRAATSLSYPTAGNLRGNDVTVGIEIFNYAIPSTFVFFDSRQDGNNRMLLQQTATELHAAEKAIDGSYKSSVSTVMSANTSYKLLGRYSKSTGITGFRNGVKGSTDSNTVDAPLASTFNIGNSQTPGSYSPCYLRNLKIWFKPLSDDRCKALTQ